MQVRFLSAGPRGIDVDGGISDFQSEWASSRLAYLTLMHYRALKPWVHLHTFVAQWTERLSPKEGVVGSNPTKGTRFVRLPDAPPKVRTPYLYSSAWIERLATNQEVGGSNPSRDTVRLVDHRAQDLKVCKPREHRTGHLGNQVDVFLDRLTGKIAGSEPVDRGSNPCPGASTM